MKEGFKLKIIGTFLKGSQNYGLDTPASDKDFVHIYVPSLEDLYFNRKPEGANENNAYWSLKFFIDKLLENDPTALEILFSTEQTFYDGDFHYLVNKIIAYVKYGQWIPTNWRSFFRKFCGITTSEFKAAYDRHDNKKLSRAIYFLYLANTIVDNNGELKESIYRIPPKASFQLKHNYPDAEKYWDEYKNYNDLIKNLAAREEKAPQFTVINQYEFWHNEALKIYKKEN